MCPVDAPLVGGEFCTGSKGSRKDVSRSKGFCAVDDPKLDGSVFPARPWFSSPSRRRLTGGSSSLRDGSDVVAEFLINGGLNGFKGTSKGIF